MSVSYWYYFCIQVKEGRPHRAAPLSIYHISRYGGPASVRPLRKRRKRFQIRRRGGTLGRPVSMDRREAQGPPLPKPGRTCRTGECPAVLEVSPPCKARPPGRAVLAADGRPQGSPLQGCKNVCKARKPRAAQCAAPTGTKKRLRIRRPPEPHLSPNISKGALSTRRSTTQRLPNPQRQRLWTENQSPVHPRLCVNSQSPLIGSP